MQSELKPCAHCGSSDIEDRESVSDYYVACRNCGARTGLVYLGASDAANAFKKRELIAAWNTRASDAEIARLTEALRAAEEREMGLREALGATESAIAEYYRYWTGGEMRGSYDGRPERNGLWQALHKARQALAGAKP